MRDLLRRLLIGSSTSGLVISRRAATDLTSGRLIAEGVSATKLGNAPLQSVRIKDDESVIAMFKEGSRRRIKPISIDDPETIENEFIAKLGIAPDELGSSDPTLLRTLWTELKVIFLSDAK